jgi:hypothetical protein
MILTSAARSGGEVRITEAERPRRIHPGQTGCQAESAAYSAPLRQYRAMWQVDLRCAASGRVAANTGLPRRCELLARGTTGRPRRLGPLR